MCFSLRCVGLYSAIGSCMSCKASCKLPVQYNTGISPRFTIPTGIAYGVLIPYSTVRYG